MIKSKKLVMAVALITACTVSSFAQGVTFENKLSSGLVNIDIIGDTTDTSFAGFTNETKAEYSSDKVDLGVSLKFDIEQEGNSLAFGKGDFINDYFIEFRPFDFLGIGFHKSYFIAGSYLPCLDGELAEANIGSDLGLFVRPIEGLVIAGGLDFISYFGKENVKPIINFGAEYSFKELVAFGVSVRDVASNDRTIGAYASFTGVEGLTINAGFTMNGNLEDYTLTGNLINAAVMFNKDALGIYAEGVISVGGEDDADNELYVGANISYQITDIITASLFGLFTNDFDNDGSWCVGINPSVDFQITEHHSLGAGVFVNIMKDFTNISFPIFWKYVF